MIENKAISFLNCTVHVIAFALHYRQIYMNLGYLDTLDLFLFCVHCQLSETESAKLEIMDRMEELEDEINNLRSQIEADSSQELSRLIQEKDQVSNTRLFFLFFKWVFTSHTL